MRLLSELTDWEKMFKVMVWKQLGEINGRKILDFGSGQGITANHFAENNDVVAVELSNEMLNNAWTDFQYKQIIGDVSALAQFEDSSFDMIICHNVLEYIDDKKQVIRELTRVLKTGGTASIVKHNRAGRVMQMAVLLDDMMQANNLLDGKNSTASKFGSIRYYEDADIHKWSEELKLIDTFGIRTFWDLQQNQDKHSMEDWQEKMVQLEERVSIIKEYKEIAFFHHLIFTKE